MLQEAAEREGPRSLAIEADTSGGLDYGASIAFEKRWPEAADGFKMHCKEHKVQLGDVFAWKADDLTVYVLALRKPGGKPTLSALQRAIGEALTRVAADKTPAVLFPRVAAGKAELEWTRLKNVLTTLGGETTADLVVFEQFVRKPSG